MNSKLLKRLCRQHDLYQTPELNETLYLHYHGFECIQELEPYTGLKVLYLEGNCLTRLHPGLEHLSSTLRCLYVQENRIEALEGFHLSALHTLNLNHNCLSSLPTSSYLKDSLPQLHTLSLTNNAFVTIESLEALRGHETLSVLDLSCNKLGEEKCPFDKLLCLLQTLPCIHVLYLKENPLILTTSHYRKRLIASLPSLTYLDERPVFDEEKEMCTAWIESGVEGERKAQQEIKKRRDAEHQLQWKQFDQLFGSANSSVMQEQKEQITILDVDTDLHSQHVEEIGMNDDIDTDEDENESIEHLALATTTNTNSQTHPATRRA